MHWLPAQQGEAVELVVPGVPQLWQRFELLQRVLAAVQVLPVQQVWPAPPHATQVLLLLLVLPLQAVPGSWHAPPVDVLEQQACPVPPHTLQT